MAVDGQQVRRPSRIGMAFRVVTARILPALFFLAILWSVVQAAMLFAERLGTQNELAARAESYDATATALAPPASDGMGRDDPMQGVRLVQFVTNTPAGDADTTESAVSGFGSGFATNTPFAEEATATSTPMPTMPPTVASTATPILAQPTDVPDTGIPATEIPKPTFIPPQDAGGGQIAGTAVPPKAPVIPRDYELVNIVLLGGDDELSDDIIRTDTMIVVSINTQTGTVAMLSLPRDLFVYVPTPTMTRLNTVYSTGESFGWSGGGFGLLRETIFYNFGIQVHYYARVNFTQFETIINTLGGVDIAVDCAYQDFYPVDDIDLSRPIEENYYLRTLEVGYHRLDGFDALWYARTRKNSDDFDRGRRQQQLLRAILLAARDNGQLADFPTLWNEFTQVVETDVPLDVVVGLLPIALQLDPARIENFTFIRTYHTTPWTPSEGAFAGQNVQLPNYERIQELMMDFYTPPTQSQLDLSGPSIAVYNGTTNAAWDLVAAQRLRESGLNAYAAGLAERTDFASSAVVDYAAEEKGNPVPTILSELNIPRENLTISPDPNRTADYAVIVGANYDSCTANVLPVEPVEQGGS